MTSTSSSSGDYDAASLTRLPVEDFEIVCLSLIVLIGFSLNLLAVLHIFRSVKSGPTWRTSFLSGPYHVSTFTLFKLNLAVADFLILGVYALGKILWLYNISWRGGNELCKVYKFVSSMGFYANSNVCVAIALDRLKVAYTSHIQGATSVRRVRWMVSTAWLLAAAAALPQIWIWRTYEPAPHFEQCTTYFKIATHEKSCDKKCETLQAAYEIAHQALVFWFPFVVLLVSYMLIALKLIHYTLRPKRAAPPPMASTSSVRAQNVAVAQATAKLLTSEIIGACAFGNDVGNDKDQCERKKSSWCRRLSIVDRLQLQAIALVRRSEALPQQSPPPPSPAPPQPMPGGGETWRRQLRSRVFVTALAVVAAHLVLWLPYNLISTLRFVDVNLYAQLMTEVGPFVEDLIVLNSLVNPLLYAFRCSP